DLAVVAAHPDVDRQGGVAVVAVFDRVHRGLGDRGLEALEAGRLEADVLYRLGDALHDLALVARRARLVELEEHVRAVLRRRTGEGDEGDVVLLLPVRAGELLERA